MTNIQAFIATIYGAWQNLPAGLRAGITVLVMGVIATAAAFGWTIPTDWVNAVAQIHAFWLVVVPVALAIFQKSVWPPLFAYILSLLGLTALVAPGEPRRLIAWRNR